MLLIHYTTGYDFKWRFGDELPDRESFCNIGHVIANGNELDYINCYMNHLPGQYGSQKTTWYGDHAKFIVGNIPISNISNSKIKK